MEAERPIEKLLRSTAQKRAEDAGEPLSLHPATRRMIRGVVALVQGKGQSSSKGWGSAAWSLVGLLPSLGCSFAVLVVLALAAALMLPPRKGHDYDMPMAPNPSPPPTSAEAPAA